LNESVIGVNKYKGHYCFNRKGREGNRKERKATGVFCVD